MEILFVVIMMIITGEDMPSLTLTANKDGPYWGSVTFNLQITIHVMMLVTQMISIAVTVLDMDENFMAYSAECVDVYRMNKLNVMNGNNEWI